MKREDLFVRLERENNREFIIRRMEDKTRKLKMKDLLISNKYSKFVLNNLKDSDTGERGKSLTIISLFSILTILLHFHPLT